MNKKKLIILILVIIISLAALVCGGLFALSWNRANEIVDKLDKGERYLEELKYEKALAMYKEILEIDPKNVEAYLGIVDTYMAMGDYEKALKYAEKGYDKTGDEIFAQRSETIEAIRSTDANDVSTNDAGSNEVSSNKVGANDIVSVHQIIWLTEVQKTEDMEYVDDATIEILEKVPGASITYVAVDGYGTPDSMGTHFQNFSVGMNANPKEGYKYVRAESETIEFYEYYYSESLGYEIPRYIVPESGQHFIYVYYEPITDDEMDAEKDDKKDEIPIITPEPLTGELMEGTEALEIHVPEDASLVSANGGVVITQRNGLYGATDYSGEEIAPNIYTGYYVPNGQGYFALAEGSAAIGVHVFDKYGKEKLFQTVNRLEMYEDKLIFCLNTESYESDSVHATIGLYDMTKEDWVYYEEADHDAGEPHGFIGAVSDKGDFYYTDNSCGNVYQIVQGADGSGTSKLIYGSVKNESTSESQTTTNIEGNGTSGGMAGEYFGSEYALWSNFSSGYVRGQGRLAADMSILMSEDGKELYVFNPYDLWQSWNWVERAYYDNGLRKYNKGKLFVQYLQNPETGETAYSLFDLSRAICETDGLVQNVEQLKVATYDSISLSDSPYYLAGEDGRWFYIDGTGQVVFDACLDCSAFYGGYAVIIDMDGRAYMIDEQFRRVAGGYVANGVRTMGGVFCVEQPNGMVYLTPPTQ